MKTCLLLLLPLLAVACSHRKKDPSDLKESFIRSDGFYPDRDLFKVVGNVRFYASFNEDVRASAQERLEQLEKFAVEDQEVARAEAIAKHIEAIQQDFKVADDQCRHAVDIGDQSLVAAYAEQANQVSRDPADEELTKYYDGFANVLIEFVPGPCPEEEAVLAFAEVQLPLFRVTDDEQKRYGKWLSQLKGQVYAIKPPMFRGNGLQPFADTIGFAYNEEPGVFVIDSLCTKGFIGACFSVFDKKGRLREVLQFEPNF